MWIGAVLANFGAFLDRTGRHVQAEALYQRSLITLERAVGPNHVNIAAILNDLAECYRLQRRYAEAEPLYLRAIAIAEAALSNDDPRLGMYRRSYAKLLRGTRRKAEARHFEKLASRPRGQETMNTLTVDVLDLHRGK